MTKTRIAKQTADNAVAGAKAVLKDKAARFQRSLVLVDPAYSTMDCCVCGARAKHRLPLSQRHFACPECGHADTRDRNAARTILVRAGFDPAVVDDLRRSWATATTSLSETGIPAL